MPSLVPLVPVGTSMVLIQMPQGVQIPPPPVSCHGVPCPGVEGMSMPGPVMFPTGQRPPSFCNAPGACSAPPGIPQGNGVGQSGQSSSTELLIGMCVQMMQLQQQQMQQQQQQMFQAMQEQQQQFMALLNSQHARVSNEGGASAGLGSRVPVGPSASGGAPAGTGVDHPGKRSLFKSIDANPTSYASTRH